MYTIRHNGRPDREIETINDALALLRDTYPDAVFSTDDGIPVTEEDESLSEDLQTREDARILCWEDAGSGENDDGAQAVASIRWE